RRRGEAVMAGSINAGSAFIARIERVGPETQLAAINRLIDRAGAERPPAVDAAQRASGIFVAGVLAAATVPLVRTPGAPDSSVSPLHRLEHKLAPFVSFGIVPLFGFANAGVALDMVGAAALAAPLPLAIALGLFLGKQLGIFGAVWLCVRTGLAGKLRGATWLQIYGVSILCGIGFTMSLFIGALAFPGQPSLQEEAKLGILLGSFLSAVAGYLVLRFAPGHPQLDEQESLIEIEIAADG
ncbi:MAG: Na+/H+ antiporter NhaA, partial [Alphaproteobacteria bacterium]